MRNYYTLEELQREGVPSINGKPARLAVIGSPIVHSRSPQMQQAALDSAALPYSYIRIEATPSELESTFHFLQDQGFIGCNITVPDKTQAAKLTQSTDPLVLATGAANTIVFDQGLRTSFNTDGPGFAQAIKETFFVELKDLRIVLLGANGGAGIALAHTCALHQCTSLALIGRSLERLEPIYHQLNERAENKTELQVATYESDHLQAILSQSDLIINATSVGLKQTDSSPISTEYITSAHMVYDILTHETALQRQAIEQGAKVSNGLSMLIHQGALSFQHWFGIEADVEAMRLALSK